MLRNECLEIQWLFISRLDLYLNLFSQDGIEVILDGSQMAHKFNTTILKHLNLLLHALAKGHSVGNLIAIAFMYVLVVLEVPVEEGWQLGY